ncbi:hypothetical protein SRHO_G00290880 [Serrasalmus rhombeus]
MERNLVLPVQPPYHETEVFEAEKPQPYLEAKLYIERIEEENKCTDRTHEPLEGPEPLEHGVSLTMYPIRVPSMHLSCATVQWDMPQTPTEDPTSDIASVDELNSSGASLDWTVNPLSSDTPSLSQEDMIDFIPEEETVQIDTDAELQHAPAVENKVNSCQTCDVQAIDESGCVKPSNEEGQGTFKDTSQTSETIADSDSVKSENNIDGEESSVCVEELETQLGLESSEALEEEDTAQDFLTGPEQALGDGCKVNESMGVYTGDRNERSSDNEIEGDEHQNATYQPSTSGQAQENAQQSVELHPIEQSGQTHLHSIVDQPEPAVPPSMYPCDVSQTVEPKQETEVSQEEQSELETTGYSEKAQVMFVATLTMISDEAVQLEQLHHTEKMQGSAWADKQEEATSEEQTLSSMDTELTGHEEQLECSTRSELLECLDEARHTEQSKQEISVDEELSGESKKSECSTETEPSMQSEGSKEMQHSDQSEHSECSTESEPSKQSAQSEICSEAQHSEQSKQSECPIETDPSRLSDLENGEQTQQANRLDQPQQTERQNCIESKQQNEDKEQSECADQTEQSLVEHTYGAQEQLEGQILESVALVVPYENDRVEVVDREEARKLAERLYKLEDVQRTDVVRHLDKDNEFSRAVGEEYLKFFDFTDQSLDEALRSFLKEVVLIGESQERERVLERFSIRYQQCNPHSFSSPESVLTLTCAVMLLNTDLHGQNVGKAMSLTDFVSNLDGMNEGENFNKDLLKTLYHSIKNHPLEWAVEEKELVKSMILEQDSEPDGSLRSKSNPFQDIAHDKKATVFQKGFLKRKAHADIDGKRIPWGKRSWKTFYAVLKGMVLYLQKDEYRKDWQSSEEVLSVHHALAEKAEDYTKRPHVFRLQTADWRVFLFEAASTEQMNSWIGRINLVSALYSSPPFPAAVGSQRKFCRPILPATQSALTLEKQLQSHAAMLQSFQEDLSALQQGAPEGRKAKARELEEYRLREEYLQHERCRYEAYVQILEVWQRLGNSSASETSGGMDLSLFDQELWRGTALEEEDDDEVDGGMKRSHSSPSLELEVAAPPVVKVRRNISERRTYRKIVIPRRNREV